jgi:curved DNA-binding protein
VKTPDGDVDMKVPAGTTHSRKLRLKGRGIPGKSPGDLYVELDITLPPADSEKAKKIYENMRDELAYDPRERMGA